MIQKSEVKAMLEETGSEPLVSVCVTAYQHSEYIAQCLESIVNQRANFYFEVIVGEDESTDGTREICIDYAERYPGIIKLFLRNRSDNVLVEGKPTGKHNFLNNLLVARGRYLAFCDGDDYWTDQRKLQKQIDLMEKESSDICFHSAIAFDEKTGKEQPIALHARNQDISFRSVALALGTAMPMHSIVVRKRVVLEFILKYGLDVAGMHFFLQLLGSGLSKKISYIPDRMGVYRRNSSSSLMANLVQTREAKMAWTNRTFYMFNVVDQITSGRQSKILEEARQKLTVAAVSSGYLSWGDALTIRKNIHGLSSTCNYLKAIVKMLLKRVIYRFRNVK